MVNKKFFPVLYQCSVQAVKIRSIAWKNKSKFWFWSNQVCFAHSIYNSSYEEPSPNLKSVCLIEYEISNLKASWTCELPNGSQTVWACFKVWIRELDCSFPTGFSREMRWCLTTVLKRTTVIVLVIISAFPSNWVWPDLVNCIQK